MTLNFASKNQDCQIWVIVCTEWPSQRDLWLCQGCVRCFFTFNGYGSLFQLFYISNNRNLSSLLLRTNIWTWWKCLISRFCSYEFRLVTDKYIYLIIYPKINSINIFYSILFIYLFNLIVYLKINSINTSVSWTGVLTTTTVGQRNMAVVRKYYFAVNIYLKLKWHFLYELFYRNKM